MRGSKVFKAVKNICFSHAQTLMLWAAYLLSNQLKNPVILSPRHSTKWEEISVELCVSAESVYENASLCVCKKNQRHRPKPNPVRRPLLLLMLNILSILGSKLFFRNNSCCPVSLGMPYAKTACKILKL